MPSCQVTVWSPSESLQSVGLPLFAGKVSAGFPSPADDYVEKSLDLNELLIQNPAATFFVRVQGESMLNAGIHPNDILIVDRSLDAVTGSVVVCALNGELTVKRLVKKKDAWRLEAANAHYPDVVVHEGLDCVVWGVATYVVHQL